MARKITRSVKSANVTYQYVEIPKSEIKENTVVVTEYLNNEEKLLRYLKRKFNSSVIEVIKILDIEYFTNKYEMNEEDFIKNAWQVDNEED